MKSLLGLLVLVGIVLLWRVGKKKKRARSESRVTVSTQRDPEFDNYMEKYDAYERVRAKYKRITEAHYSLTEKIGVAYTVANNLKLPTSPEMEAVIDLCKKDIALAPDFRLYCDEVNASGYFEDRNTFTIKEYSSFKRLAIIYEKRKEYEKAIEVCRRAISLGFTHDGTDGQMLGRIARLMKKQGEANLKIKGSAGIEGEVIEE